MTTVCMTKTETACPIYSFSLHQLFQAITFLMFSFPAHASISKMPPMQKIKISLSEWKEGL